MSAAKSPSKLRRLMTSTGSDISLLLDAHAEAKNNLERGETDFFTLNLRSVFVLARRIERRRKTAQRLLRKGAAR